MKSFRLQICILVGFALFSSCSGNQKIYVSPDGSDENSGSKSSPLSSIQTAVDRLDAGGECILLPGIYRQGFDIKQSGYPDAPIIINADPSGEVIITGNDIVDGNWTKHQGNIYKIKMDHAVGQIFVDGKMMQYARWPNMLFPEELWSCSKWASAETGSRHMKIIDPELAETGIDWTGATAVLNVAHQFFTWSRIVENHEAGSDLFTYRSVDDFDWRTGHEWTSGQVWEDDRYYLVGKMEALDSPAEWFYDKNQKQLFLWMPGGDDPSGHLIETRRRNYCATASDISHVQLKGIRFFATAFDFRNVESCLIEDCHFEYPSFGVIPPEGADRNENDMDFSTGCSLIGSGNVIRKCSFKYGSLDGLDIQGNGNKVENSIFHDFSWDVSLKFKPIMVINTSEDQSSPGNLISRNTVYNSGSPCIQFQGYNNIVEYNHVYNGLMSRCGGSKDGSLVYTQRKNCRGTIIRYNWVHDAIPELIPSTWGGGIGIRGDDRTRGLTVHHNVVWNIGGCGIVVKGDSNKVYHNTVMKIGRPDRPEGNYIQLMIASEVPKPQHDDLDTRLMQTNQHSVVFNNVAKNIVGSWGGDLFPDDQRKFNNYQELDYMLRDPDNLDFIPVKGSPLIDGGKVVDGLTGDFTGSAPDIGAYELGGEPWKPGADWKDQ